jgi:hypothetical protein
MQVKPVKVHTSLQVYDIGNKPNASTLHHRHRDTLCCKRFYPRPHTKHAALLDQWMKIAGVKGGAMEHRHHECVERGNASS